MELMRGSLLTKAWRRLTRLLGLPMNRVERAVHRFGSAYPEAVFVQIGANDGDTADPLRLQIERWRWSGVMVEPVPFVFEKLRARYEGHPRIRLEMSAIADRTGVMPFYHLREALPGEKVWPWYHFLGSFRRDVVLKHADAVPDIEARIVETPVPCLTFEELCRRHELGAIDLLMMDTEGYDFEILKTIDFARWRPRMLVYESCHLSPADRQAAQGLLSGQGYRYFESGFDTAALDQTRLGERDQGLMRLFAIPA